MNSTSDSLFLPSSQSKRRLLLVAMFLAALGVRLFHMDAAGFSPLRQNYSTIIARSLFFKGNPSIPQWRQEMALGQAAFVGEREPRVMERIAAAAYKATGAERLWLPRLLSVFSWLIGGVFLFALGRRIGSIDSAVLATAIYLFLPFATVASRALMPEPLNIMALVIGLFAMDCYFEKPTALRLFAAALLCSVSIFIKAPAAFPIMGAFVGLVLWKDGLKRSTINLKTIAFVVVMMLLPAAFYGRNLLNGSRLAGYVAYSFRPYLLLRPTFWAGWLAMIYLVLGFTLFVAAMFGLSYLSRGRGRALLSGSWIGYIFFGLTVPYQTSTHDYYHLLIVPSAALCAALTFEFLIAQIQGIVPSKTARLCLFCAAVLFGAAASGVRILEYSYDRQARLQENEKVVAREVGDIVGHSRKTMFMSISSGIPLQYYGEVAGVEIATTNPAIETYIDTGMKQDQSVESLFDGRNTGFRPEYFIVTELLEFRRRPDLVDFCTKNFILKAHGIDYLVYDLRAWSPNQR